MKLISWIRHTKSARVAERDRWLLRSRRLRRAIAVLATALVLGFGGLAAHASSASHHTSTGSSSSSSSSGGSPAPKSTSQSLTVTSGGS